MHCRPALNSPVLPDLMPMDVPEHEGLRLGSEQRTSREFVVKACHGHAMLAQATKHGAVRHPDGGQARCNRAARLLAANPRNSTARCSPTASCRLSRHRRWRQQPPCSPPARRKTRHAARYGSSVKCQPVRHHPSPVSRECHLSDPVGDMHRVAATQQPENSQGTGRLMRKRALQHQHRAMVCQTPDLARQSFHGG